MSKIAETKANQWILNHKDGDVLYVQDAYIAAYDQSLQDFLEKACEWLCNNSEKYVRSSEEEAWCNDEELVNDFKNYMKNESD